MSYNTRNSSNAISVTNLGIIPNTLRDNRINIQNAINSLYTYGGGTLFFPKGTYLFSGTVDITGKDITLLGEEGSVLLGGYDETAKKINVSGARNINFYGLVFDSNRSGTVNVSNQYGFINTISSTNINIENCEFYNTKNSSIFLGGNSRFISILNNYFTGHFCGIFSYMNTGEPMGQQFVISNNKFGDTWVGGDVGESACIKLQTQPGYTGVSAGHVISNNVINSNIQMGIELWCQGRDNTVSNNTVKNTVWGISLDGQFNSTVVGNTVRSVSYMGIECATACKNCIIANNVVMGYKDMLVNTGTRVTQYGLTNSNAQCDGLVYDGNIVEGCTNYGINVQTTTNTIISNNIIKNSTTNLYFQNGQGTQVLNNLFESSAETNVNYHIFVDASNMPLTGFYFSNNKFRGKTNQQSIFFYGGASSTGTLVRDVCIENNITDETTSGGYGQFLGGNVSLYNYMFRNNFSPSGSSSYNSIADASDSSSPYKSSDVMNGFTYYGSSSWAVPGSGTTGNSTGIWVCVWSGGGGEQNNVRISALNYFNSDQNHYNAIEVWATMVPYEGFYQSHSLYASPFYSVNLFPYIKEVQTICHSNIAQNSVWFRINGLSTASSGQLFYFKYSKANGLPAPFSTYNTPSSYGTAVGSYLVLEGSATWNNRYKFQQGISVGNWANAGIYGPASGALAIYTEGGHALYADKSANVAIGGNVTTPSVQLSLGTTLADTKLGLWDAGGSNLYGLGIQGNQMRFHVDTSASRFSFLDAPAGNELFTIKGNGNIGINNSSPQNKLTINTAGTAYGFTHTNATVTGGSYIYSSNASGFLFGASSNHYLSLFGQGSNPLLQISSTGVSIGVPFPSKRGLIVDTEVNVTGTTSSSAFTLWDSAGGYGAVAKSTNKLQIYNNVTSGGMTIVAPNGYIGLGHTNPTQSVHFSGTLGMASIPVSTTANVGGVTVPATAAGFITVNITGGNFKLPYYNV